MVTVFEEQSLNGDVTQPKQGMFDVSATQNYRLGTRWHRPDGRTFHYAQANASTALVRGDVIQGAIDAFTANEQQDLTIGTASAIGDNFVFATTTTDAIVEGQMEDGWIIVSDGTVATGGAQIFQIKSAPAGAAGSTKFTIYDTVQTAISTSGTKAGVIMNPYRLVVQMPASTATGWILGVAPVAVAVSKFFWLQTWGMSAVLVKGALTVGEDVVLALTTAGSCDAQVAGASSTATARIGYCGHTTDTTDWGFVYLQIAP